MVIGVLVLGVVLIGGGGSDQPRRTAAEDKKPAEVQLPRGGRSILPEFRVVA